MKKLFLPGILLIFTFSSLQAQTPPLSTNIFLQQNGKEPYQCIQIRRGDIITLTGHLEFINSEVESEKKRICLISSGGRTILLKGKRLSEISTFYQTIDGNITITGKILFEGREEQYAEMEVSAYRVSE